MGAPVFRSNGAYVAATVTGPPATVMALPAGYAVDDILVLIIETGNNTGAGMSGIPTLGQTNLTNNGWTRAANTNTHLLSPTVAASQNTSQDIWWNRATNTSQTAVDIGDSGDHTFCCVLAFSGCVKTGDPWDGAINVTMTTASAQTTGKNLTTTFANTLMIHVLSGPRDSATVWINASPIVLVNGDAGDVELTERCDWGTSLGTGGSVGVLTHRKSNRGLTANCRANTTTVNVSIMWSGALKGVAEQSWGELTII